jgi:FkbM family methyltransferase
MCEIASEMLKAFISRGQMVIVNKAIYFRTGEVVPFYLNPDKDDWGSISKGKAEKGSGHSTTINVPTTTLTELLDLYGTPYYIKCDIEGGDEIVLQQLAADTRRPDYISVEANGVEDFDLIERCGYRSVQLVNQWLHAFTRCPNPAREGSYAMAKFDGETSGLFGRELPPDRWIDVVEAKQRYAAWASLRGKDETLAIGWLDIHARF